ncbi:hypothetical protein [Streptomyces sp. NPDC002788]
MRWSPTSRPAPHLEYGTTAPDKDQRAAVAPYRAHTAWMAGHQLEGAHRDRYRGAQHADDALQRLRHHARVTGDHAAPFRERAPVHRPVRRAPGALRGCQRPVADRRQPRHPDPQRHKLQRQAVKAGILREGIARSSPPSTWSRRSPPTGTLAFVRDVYLSHPKNWYLWWGLGGQNPTDRSRDTIQAVADTQQEYASVMQSKPRLERAPKPVTTQPPEHTIGTP